MDIERFEVPESVLQEIREYKSKFIIGLKEIRNSFSSAGPTYKFYEEIRGRLVSFSYFETNISSLYSSYNSSRLVKEIPVNEIDSLEIKGQLMAEIPWLYILISLQSMIEPYFFVVMLEKYVDIYFAKFLYTPGNSKKLSECITKELKHFFKEEPWFFDLFGSREFVAGLEIDLYNWLTEIEKVPIEKRERWKNTEPGIIFKESLDKIELNLKARIDDPEYINCGLLFLEELRDYLMLNNES